MVSTQRRSRSPSSEVASRLLMARIPVSGVRTSWAKAASAASTMPGDFARPAALALPRLRAVFAADLPADFLTRLFVGRFFGGLALRVGRDLAAMIPHSPMEQNGRPSRRSHGRGVAGVPPKKTQTPKIGGIFLRGPPRGEISPNRLTRGVWKVFGGPPPGEAGGAGDRGGGQEA